MDCVKDFPDTGYPYVQTICYFLALPFRKRRKELFSFPSH